jgi:hypothetical protein
MGMRGIPDLKENCVNVKKDGEGLTVMVRSFILVSSGSALMIDIVCETDKACAGFKIRTPSGQESEDDDPMVCYKGGLAVHENYQMCDVTSESFYA